LQFCGWTEIIVILDDYGEKSWTYCQKAVGDYRRDHGISERRAR